MSTIRCLICGDDFQHTGKEGRPPSYCSAKCKAQATADPVRRCRTCGTTYLKNKQLPAHCSAACRDAAQAECRQCGAPTEDVFCSSECIAAHYPGRTCSRCNQPVPPPLTPPFNRMPRYCSEECRTGTALDRGHLQLKAHRTSVQLKDALDAMAYTKLWKLPTKELYVPYRVPTSQVPDLQNYDVSAKVLNSIAYWNAALPHFETLTDPLTAVAELGRTGLRPDQPDGIRPLHECWPWVNAAFDRNNVVLLWSGARLALGLNHTKIEHQRTKTMERLMVYESLGTPQFTANGRQKKPSPYYLSPDGVTPSQFISDLRRFVNMFVMDTDRYRLWLTAKQVAFLESDEWWAFQDKLFKLTKTTKWRVADYAEDPKQPEDRLLRDIDKILTRERIRGR